MPATQVYVQNTASLNNSAGTTAYQAGGKQGDGLVSQVHGNYYTQALNGAVFIGSTTAAGSVVPIYTTLTSLFSLWNPTGSGKNLVPTTFTLGWTATTAALGTIVYTYSPRAGVNTSTLTDGISAYTAATPVNGLIGSGLASVARFCTSVTLVTASSFLKGSGISIGATTAATATLPMWVAREDFDGQIVIPPGVAIHVMASTAIAITATMSLVWEEVPA